MNNLKQLTLAVHSYDSSWGGFPPSAQTGIVNVPVAIGRTFSMQSALLPYIDQAPLFNAVNFQLYGRSPTSTAPENLTALKTNIAAFLCPTDTGGYNHAYGSNNYRTNMGICELCDEQDSGAFVYGRLGSTSIFQDGMSNTLAFSEKLVSSQIKGRYESNRDWIVYLGLPSPRSGDQSGQACSVLTSNRFAEFNAGSSWLYLAEFNLVLRSHTAEWFDSRLWDFTCQRGRGFLREKLASLLRQRVHDRRLRAVC